jgi:hypothetical protein
MKKILFLITILTLPTFLTAQTYVEVAKVSASDKDEEANYGNSVSISGNYAIVGAVAEDFDENGNNYAEDAGAVYFVEKSGSGWQEVKKVVNSDRTTGDFFGSNVAISGNYAIVGAWGEDEDVSGGNTMTQSGSAYIFERIGGTWTEVQKIVASDRLFSDRFGRSVAIDGDIAVVGNDQSTIYIFERNGSGVWEEVYWLDSNTGDHFGYSVSISGNTILVGARRNSYDENGGDFEQYAGAAYFVNRDGSGNWNLGQKIVAADREDGDHFGNAVAIDGDYAIVGAHFNGTNANGAIVGLHSGAAYIFERSGGTWSQVKKALAPDGEYSDEFGISVSLSGDYALVGLELEDYPAPSQFEPGIGNAGAAYLFKRNSSGVWSYPTQLSASDKGSGDHFGNALSISGEHMIIGAIWDSFGSGQNTLSAAGSAYIFEQSSVGIEEATNNVPLQLYPNPSSGVVVIQADNVEDVRVYDGLGQVVYQESSMVTSIIQLDLSHLTSGLYTCEVRTAKGVGRQRLITQ